MPRCDLGESCGAPTAELREQYTCAECKRQLHSHIFGCSKSTSDGRVLCPEGHGCGGGAKAKPRKRTKKAPNTASKEDSKAKEEEKIQEAENSPASATKKSPPGDSKPAASRMSTVRGKTLARSFVTDMKGSSTKKRKREDQSNVNQDEEHENGLDGEPKAPDEDENAEEDGAENYGEQDVAAGGIKPSKRAFKPGGKKRGVKAGMKMNTNKTQEDWFFLCQKFRALSKKDKKLTRKGFLESPASGEKFTGTLSEQQSMGRYLRKFDDGVLKPTSQKRRRLRVFQDIEEKLVEYLDFRANAYKRARCGVSWSALQKKCLQFADILGHDNFQASSGWLSDTLRDYLKDNDAPLSFDAEVEAEVQESIRRMESSAAAAEKKEKEKAPRPKRVNEADHAAALAAIGPEGHIRALRMFAEHENVDAETRFMLERFAHGFMAHKANPQRVAVQPPPPPPPPPPPQQLPPPPPTQMLPDVAQMQLQQPQPLVIQQQAPPAQLQQQQQPPPQQPQQQPPPMLVDPQQQPQQLPQQSNNQQPPPPPPPQQQLQQNGGQLQPSPQNNNNHNMQPHLYGAFF